MAKDNERQVAQTLYVDHCLTAKEIAEKINVSEKTIGKWVIAGKWKQLRTSKQTTPDVLISKYSELQNTLLDNRLKMERNNERGTKAYNNIIDEMSKVNAMIETLQKDGRPSLRIHILVIEKFMASLQQQNPKLFMALIDFQKEYLTQLAEEFK